MKQQIVISDRRLCMKKYENPIIKIITLERIDVLTGSDEYELPIAPGENGTELPIIPGN